MNPEIVAKKLIAAYAGLRGSDIEIRKHCDPDAYLEWNCCEYHRHLKALHIQCNNLAKSLEPSMPDYEGMRLSPNFWRAFKARFDYDVPNNWLTPEPPKVLLDEDESRLRHALHATVYDAPETWGARNHYVAGEEDHDSMMRLLLSGFVVQGRDLGDGVILYHATRAGCAALGFTSEQTDRACRPES